MDQADRNETTDSQSHDRLPAGESTVEAASLDGIQGEASGEPSPAAAIVEGDAVADAGQPIRTGSPFAAVPERTIPQYDSEVEGVWKETARGATVASLAVFVFGIASLYFFPGGAIMIAALGVATSCMGLASAWWHVGTVALLLNALVCGAGFWLAM